MRTLRKLLALPALAGLLVTSGCLTSPADRSETLALVNATRDASGVAPLTENAQLNTKAENWAKHLADTCSLSHSNIRDEVPADWQELGENVGRAGSVVQVHDAFLNSPPHLKNIMSSSFNQVGIGVSHTNCDGDEIFTVLVFMKE